MARKVYSIALGANLPSPAGSPRETLEAALRALAGRDVRVVARSRWFATPAFPPGAGPDFVNGAALVETALAPEGLLAAMHAVERALGRDRRRRWAPRACDLDLLSCGGEVSPDRETVAAWMALDPARQATEAPPALILPHPRLHERGFVLLPLADVAPDWVHPILGRSVREMLAALPDGALAGAAPLEE
ncbi:2-amino-4-hydroxy-6-hydroxymethyldihydropteridine diphosphokinase [Amaricoccus sp.]|uniref:2-amino-4-hydroxy-6- hydroxymethyldihydropteridine diphosphokinase n=1 Tax=Amaricoccus sp. TaxID=1872485 RepID=UPI001B590FBF|nr:2-amino-4-hydroxy-6-hydroxymethyldihydropteridine diphosphokinase [Amaricoccus sp.]MBP7240990.1 2-amino-4-hydroxy-6-hydroxymethyldihydropteridine diphosphokinase [Amaricoccus sp.]